VADVDIRIQARDESRDAFDKAKGNMGGLLSTAAALGPALAPVGAAAVAAVASLASTLGGAAVAAGAFKLAVQPQMAAVQDAAAAQEKYNDTVAKYGKDSKEAEAALKEYKTTMAGMPAATQATAKEFVGLKSDFKSWSDSLAGSTMPIFTKGIQILRTILPTLTPIVKATARVLDDLMSKLKAKVESKGFEDFMKKVAAWSESGLKKVVGGIGAVYRAVKDFVMGEGFREFLAMGSQAGGNIGDILKKLAQFMAEFIKAAGPLAGLSFVALGILADALNAIPQSVLEILAPTIMAIVVAMKAWRLATLAATAAQWLYNAALAANPLGLIVLAIIAVVVAIVALWKKNEGFRQAVIGAWNAIKDGVTTAWNWIRDKILAPLGRFFTETVPRWASTLKDKVIGAWNAVKEGVRTALDFLKKLFLNWTGPGLIIKHWDKIRDVARTAINKVKEYWNGFIGFFKGLPGKISSAASNMWNGIKSSFRTTVNWIISKWNNLKFTIGGGSILGKKLPSVTLNTPNIPYLAKGGIASGLAMVGERGRELVDLPGGSRVRTNADTERILSRNAAVQRLVLEVHSGGNRLDDLLIEILRKSIRTKGGNVQLVLGRN
jgi:phage-related protein